MSRHSGEDSPEAMSDVILIEGEVYGLRSEVTAINVRAGVASLPSNCFMGCRNLTAVILPVSLRTINSHAFSGSNLKSIIIPNGVLHIFDGAFSQCPSLETVILPNSVQSIGFSCFWGCVKLRSIGLPECFPVTAGIEKQAIIPLNAFANCESLEHIVIPEVSYDLFIRILISPLEKHTN